MLKEQMKGAREDIIKVKNDLEKIFVKKNLKLRLKRIL
jgi:hypothetical protein